MELDSTPTALTRQSAKRVAWESTNWTTAKRAASLAHQVNFKMFSERPSVNFVKYQPTLVVKQETGRVLIVRQGGHPRRGALSVKPAELGCTAMAVNRAH